MSFVLAKAKHIRRKQDQRILETVRCNWQVHPLTQRSSVPRHHIPENHVFACAMVSWSLGLSIIFIIIFVFLIVHFVWRQPDNRRYIMDLLHKARAHIRRYQGSDDNEEASPAPHTLVAAGGTSIPNVTLTDVLRYRYHHGTNVGSVFILERWLTPSAFPSSCSGSSELAAVQAWIQQEGIEAATKRFETHWRDYVSDSDLDWLRDVAKCTTIRLPIGYFTLGPKFCEHTAFKKVASVYTSAWSFVKALVSRCNARGIGTLLDLHGLPGGANDQEHSGTNSARTELWGSSKNLQLATKCVCFMVQEAKTMEGVAGIQIINEAETEAKGMYDWYQKVLSEVSHVDAAVPIYVSDAWNFDKALTWSQSKNAVQMRSVTNPVVIDTHLYWAFTDADKQKTPQQITYETQSKLSELDGKDGAVLNHGASQAIVGEYSCVLTEDSWAKRHDVPKDQLVREFGNAQSKRYQQRAGGSFFWTYRMDWMPGGEWGFKEKVEQGAITPPLSLTLTPAEIQSRNTGAQNQRDLRRGQTWGSHCKYWDTNFPGHYEHQRFADGWDVGFGDATAFFGMRSARGWSGGDRVGMLDLWCLKRLRESKMGGEEFAWEWETGLRQGVRDFYELAGV